MSLSNTTQIATGNLVFDAVVAGPADGDAVVLLHGFPQTTHAWRGVIDPLARAGLRVVAFDQRGYSPGARPSGDAAYETGRLVADVLAVADALHIDRFHVVGHDWGGFVAWQLALSHPERLRSLVAVSTPHPRAFGKALRYVDQRVRSSYVPVFRSRHAARLFGAGGAAGLRALFAASGLPRPLAQPYLDKARHDPGWLDAALAWYRVNTSGLVGGGSADGVAVRRTVDVPTMYVWSTRDSALGPHAAYWTGEYVTGPYRFEVLPGVSHWIPEMAADQLSRLLLDHVHQDTPAE